ncbi:SDR family oxidoreductase [Nocardia sp. NBC_00508]|uniref:SDR family NAD(P)-dependent oxidoreductase n=1 Tax=Nocardia sp. NBC_00508 TaxID=2975992 RepID=UPI002E823284|nr:SDR family oxidoreductase [Nocardia sp. NBC_00508]WUD69339.1 SDR family oxidoreductase [Nocardia sp. NBC_00508]
MSTGERRVCLLTGASGTLGDAFCRAYYRDYDIVAVCRTHTPAAPSQLEWYVDPLAPDAAVPENDSRIFVVRSDLTQPGEVERVVDLALARFGHVDLLVNNAAHIRLHPRGIVDGDAALADFDPHFALNVGVPLRFSARLAQRCWLHAGPENRARNRNIVNVSSISGSEVYPGQTLYSASKAALNQLTRNIAAEFAEFGVRANAIAPNSFPTLVPTEQVARAIVELDASDGTGAVYGVGVELNQVDEADGLSLRLADADP